MLFFVTVPRNVIFKHQVHAEVKLVQTQQHVDRRAAKRTAAYLVVHFVGTRLAEALMTARHQRDACIMPRDTPRRSQQLRQLIRSLAYQRRHWCRHPFPTRCPCVIILMLCIVSHSRASGSSSSSASEWLSLSIFCELTIWLTARRNCSRVYAWRSNLCKHISMRLSFVRLTRFLARPMARPRVTLLTSDTLSMAICCRCPINLQTNQRSVATLTGRFACELRLPTSTHESHDSHISSGTLEYFLLMAFHTLLLPHFPLLHFPLPHFQRPLRDNVTFTRTGSTHVAWTARHCGGGGGGGIETRTSRQHATRTCTSTYSQPRRDSACRLNMLLFPVLRLHQSSLHKLWTLTIGSCYCR